MMRSFTLSLFLCLSVGTLYAQKRPLDHSVYDSWQSIGNNRISNDGNWVLYNVVPQEGDASLTITNLKDKSSLTVPRVTVAQFSNDNKYAVFSIKPFFKDVRQAKIKKKKADDMPKDTLGYVLLGTKTIVKVPRVKSFKMPEKGFGVLAYQLDKVPADTTKKKKNTGGKDNDFFADDETPAAGKTEGTDLIVKNLTTGVERTFKGVTDYYFNKSGNRLAFTVTPAKKDSATVQAGAFLLDIEKGILKTLVKGKGTFKSFAFTEDGTLLAFAGEQSPEKKLPKIYNLYYHSESLDTAQVIVDHDMPGLPAKWAVNGDSRVFFSKDGLKLYFGTAPIRAPKDTTIVDFEVAKVDVWSYKDDYLQPMQLKNVDRELKRGYMAMIDPFNSDAKVVQLADEKLPEVEVGNEGNAAYALGSTDVGNRIEMQWTGTTLKDIYLINVKDGSRKKIADKLSGNASLSPAGKYVIWYNRQTKGWYTYNVLTQKTTYLNNGMKEAFYNEENDVPEEPGAYGMGGWIEDDKAVLLYDKYDIWSFNPDGSSAPKNITNGFGRKNNITLKYTRFDKESRFIKKGETIWLDAFNHANKQNGWYKKDVSGSRDPELVVMAPFNYSEPVIAKNAPVFIYQKSNYEASPNVYVSSDFKIESKLSDINLQQKNYNWGTVELVKWTTPKGYQAEGLLFKPENFDPNKKYPMIAYFYEKLSQGMYSYQPPSPTPSRLNISYFVSNGYLVFTPDISYETGHPGQSAVEYINSGVESLKKNSWVDGAHIGIQGQSWGGYQVAYLITRTNMYAAAWAGAPVANMTSAYGGIRWESGMTRQFQYEKQQSRIGATLWEKPELYIENSPLFHLPKVNTPVVIMANDADGAVPWYQGIEMFTGLRRLNKPVWMLNYNNEAHNLVQRQNRKDIQIREQQFFDYYLKGAKAPSWMVNGIPATEKGKTWGFELVNEKP